MVVLRLLLLARRSLLAALTIALGVKQLTMQLPAGLDNRNHLVGSHLVGSRRVIGRSTGSPTYCGVGCVRWRCAIARESGAGGCMAH